jgi:hypothetical protein
MERKGKDKEKGKGKRRRERIGDSSNWPPLVRPKLRPCISE